MWFFFQEITFSSVKLSDIFFFLIFFFFRCNNFFFTFERQHIFSEEKKTFRKSFLGGGMFFSCVKPTKFWFSGEKNVFMFIVTSLCTLHAVNSRTLFHSTHFLVRCYLYEKKGTLSFHQVFFLYLWRTYVSIFVVMTHSECHPPTFPRPNKQPPRNQHEDMNQDKHTTSPTCHHSVPKTAPCFGNMLSFSYKINWKQHHEWPRCCWEENICACGTPTFWKHIEHITASPRNYTWHPTLTASLKSIKARLRPTWTLLTYTFSCSYSGIAHKLPWCILDNGWTQRALCKETEAESGFMYCFIVLLSLGP